MPVAAAREQTVATLLSGPASGVIGAAYVAGQAGLPNVITLDVGGTSADMAVVENGRPRWSTSEHVGGVPVMMPVVGVTRDRRRAAARWPGWTRSASQGRTAEHRRASGAGLLRARRQGSHAHRRVPRVRLPRPGAVPGRADAAATASSPRRRSPASPPRSARRRTRRPRASCASPSPTCTRSSPRSSRAPPSTRATSRSCRSVAPGPCVGRAGRARGRHPHRVRAALAGHAVRARARSAPTSSTTRCAPCTLRVAASPDGAGAFEGPALREHVRGAAGGAGGLAGAPRRRRGAGRRFRHAADMRYVGQSYEIEVPVDPAWLAPGGGPAALAAFHQRARARVRPRRSRGAGGDREPPRAAPRRRDRACRCGDAAGATKPPAARATRRIWLDGRPTEARVFERDDARRAARAWSAPPSSSSRTRPCWCRPATRRGRPLRQPAAPEGSADAPGRR